MHFQNWNQKTPQNQTNQTQEKTTKQEKTKPKQKPKISQMYQNLLYKWHIIGSRLEKFTVVGKFLGLAKPF